MPEKTRDRKNWFPRFKSNWLGTYRSKQMFVCCECAVTDAESARYKGAEGKHCVCGRDQWHLAKSVEEAEYNRRMEISKSFGGIRYEEAVERLKGMGGSEYAATEFDDKRVRCESDESSASTASLHSTDSGDFHLHKRIKTESHELKLSMGPSAYGYDHHVNHYAKQYPASHASYAPLNPEVMGSYDHLAPPAFGDEESFGELLQGILEDDPRAKMARAAPYPAYAHMKRFPESTMTLPPPPPQHDMEFDFYQAQHHHQATHHGYSGYHQPHGFHHQHMVPAVATASFPSAV